MKKQTLIYCLVCLSLIACNGLSEGKTKTLIPGTYVRFSAHEFGKEHDTLVITALKGQFQILRKWKYERVLDGVVREPEYRQKLTTAIFDLRHGSLHESETGNPISFGREEGALFVGTTKYQKIK